MNELVLAIPILAMVLTYKLLSKLITARQAKPLTTMSTPSFPELEETPDELRARAELMQRRIQVLEEIIASEKGKELA